MSWFDEEDAKIESGQFTGVHKCVIREAEHNVTDTGAESLTLRVELEGRKDFYGNPKIINLEPIYLTNGKQKTSSANRVSALFCLLLANPDKLKKYRVERYNFSTKAKEPKIVEMYEELLNKKVALFIQLRRTYRLKKIDPATAYIVRANEAGIWLPDYKKDKKLSYQFVRAFDYKTIQTYSEITSKKPAKIYLELASKMSDYEEEKMNKADFLKYAKKQADKAGMKLDESIIYSFFDEYNEIEDSDLPADLDLNSDQVPF